MIKKIGKKLSERPRLRILVVLVVIVFAIIIGLRLLSSSSVQKAVNVPSSHITSPNSGSVEQAPGVEKQRYKQLSEENKKSSVTEAAQTGKSYFSNVFEGAKVVETQSDDKGTTTKKPVATVTVSDEKDTTKTNAKSLQAENPISFYRQQHQGKLPSNVLHSEGVQSQTDVAYDGVSSESVASMRKQLDSLAGTWAMPTQKVVVGSKKAEGGKGSAAIPVNVAIKAGSILFAVLDTAVNSDQPGTPVLATVATGKYRGARLIGAFQREKDRLVVTFTTMSLQSKANSIGINAYAVNAETAQTALASDVNHHYLLRYGSLFAAAFLQGFGNAFQNIQPTCPAGTPCTVIGTPDQINVTTEQAAYQGLGQVGTQLSSVAQNQFNMPPTVTLDQGIGLGILFMNDVSMDTASNDSSEEGENQ